MEFYRIEANRKASHGYALYSPAFGITVDAGEDELDKAVKAMRGLMAEEAEKRLAAGELLPADDELGDVDGPVFYMQTDFEGQFVARTNETVRRNISMPAWMDLRLRRHNVDASRLFQDAAAAKLKELEQEGAGARQIRDEQDLEDMCPREILEKWFRRRLMELADRW